MRSENNINWYIQIRTYINFCDVWWASGDFNSMIYTPKSKMSVELVWSRMHKSYDVCWTRCNFTSMVKHTQIILCLINKWNKGLYSYRLGTTNHYSLNNEALVTGELDVYKQGINLQIRDINVHLHGIDWHVPLSNSTSYIHMYILLCQLLLNTSSLDN